METDLNEDFIPWLIGRLLELEDFRFYVADRVTEKLSPKTPEKEEVVKVRPEKRDRIEEEKLKQLEQVLEDMNAKLIGILDYFRTSEGKNLALTSIVKFRRPAVGGQREASDLFSTLLTLRRCIPHQTLHWDSASPNKKFEYLDQVTRAGRALNRILAPKMEVGSLIQISEFLTDFLTRSLLPVAWRFSRVLGHIAVSFKEFQDHVIRPLMAAAQQWDSVLEKTVQRVTSDLKNGSESRPKWRFHRLMPDFTPKGFLLPLHLQEKRRIGTKNVVFGRNPVDRWCRRENAQFLTQKTNPRRISQNFLNSETQTDGKTSKWRMEEQENVWESVFAEVCGDLDSLCSEIVEEMIDQELRFI